MTGPEHYREAQNHLKFAKGDADPEWHQRQAQVHATLALAAATALGTPVGSFPTADWNEWLGTASAWEKPDGDQP